MLLPEHSHKVRRLSISLLTVPSTSGTRLKGMLLQCMVTSYAAGYVYVCILMSLDSLVYRIHLGKGHTRRMNLFLLSFA